DKVFMLEKTWYSVISTESCSSILWRSCDFKEQAADSLKLTALDMKRNKLIDEIITEHIEGAHYDRETKIETEKKTIVKTYKLLAKKETDELLAERMAKYEAMGDFKE